MSEEATYINLLYRYFINVWVFLIIAFRTPYQDILIVAFLFKKLITIFHRLPCADKQMVMPGDDTSLTLTLKKDVPLEVNQRFTLREGHINVGTGVITQILE